MALIASVALAASQPAITVSVETGNLILTVLGGGFSLLFASLGWFFVRTLKQIDYNQRALQEAQLRLLQRIENLSKEHYYLAGEHSALHRGEATE